MAYFLNNLPPVNQYTKTTKEKYFVDKSELLLDQMNFIAAYNKSLLHIA